MKKTIDSVMTLNPHSIGIDIALNTAEEHMKKFGLRHLPVLKSGRVVGMLSDRDIKLMSKFKDFGSFTVEDAMSPDPYVVEPGTLLSEVTGTMAEKKFGSVIVAEKGKPVGIFTAVDGMRLLAEAYR